MNKPYFTRKNLMAWSLSFFYAFLLVFVGLCLEGSYKFMNPENPFAALARGLHFKEIVCGVSGFMCLILLAIYIIACTGFIIYERRYAVINNKNPHSFKMIAIYFGTFLASTILSLGVGLVIQSPISKENLGNVFTFLGQTLVITTLAYIVLVLFIGAILMLVVNFIFVDKPYRFFNPKNVVEFEDDDIEVQNISSSFDVNPIITTNSEMSTVAAPSSVATETISTSKVEKLDDREKVFPSLSTIDNKYNGFENEGMVSDEITLEQLCHRFRNYLAKEEKLYFDIDTIRIFISGFAASHFMILEGLSGTGKSSLPRYFAKFVNGNSLFIPVQATWRDKTSILGYFNDFSKTYSETDFLIQLYEANYNPDQINLFVLDEMNISRVEYYFADFLSILEYPTPSWKLRIMQLPYQFIPPVKLQDGYIQIPTNSYFIGTANKDDSTFSITDKVYDRAITIDFDNRNIPFEVNEDASPIQLSHSKFNQLLEEASTHKEYQLTEKDYENFQKVCDFIYEEFDITFGNRVMNQISLLVPTFMACGGKKEDALDFLLSRKIIVKLEGRFEEYIKGGLKQLLQLLEKTYGSHTFEKSEKAIHNLMRKL